MRCPYCGHQILSRKAELTLSYMRREAPKRGGYMFEGARPSFEAGIYHAADITALLEADAIEPHADPNKGWVVKGDH